MLLNTKTDEWFKKVQAQEIELVREEILTLSQNEQELIKQGEEVIDDHLRRSSGRRTEDIIGLNIFDLKENIPGNVMKYLVMLYAAAGFHHVSTSCKCFSSADNSRQVKYPNQISMRISG
jgi:hypothetical protein